MWTSLLIAAIFMLVLMGWVAFVEGENEDSQRRLQVVTGIVAITLTFLALLFLNYLNHK